MDSYYLKWGTLLCTFESDDDTAFVFGKIKRKIPEEKKKIFEKEFLKFNDVLMTSDFVWMVIYGRFYSFHGRRLILT